MERPATLAEVAARSRSDRENFQFHLSEFLDEFYMDPGAAERQDRLDPVPRFLGDPELDAWLCASAEYLAEQWGVEAPSWVEDAAGGRLTAPCYPTELPRLRAVLRRESPPAFRRRNLFVEAEPLRRATAAAGRSP